MTGNVGTIGGDLPGKIVHFWRYNTIEHNLLKKSVFHEKMGKKSEKEVAKHKFSGDFVPFSGVFSKISGIYDGYLVSKKNDFPSASR